MNGFNQQQLGQQFGRRPFYALKDGDNWVQLLSLQEREMTSQFSDKFGNPQVKVIRDVLVNAQQFPIVLTKITNQQLQSCIQSLISAGKNPLEYTYNIRKNRFSPLPVDVRYQVVAGEWVGLPQAYGQINQAYSQQSQNTSSTPQMPPKPPFPYMPIVQKQDFMPQPIQNPFQQGMMHQMTNELPVNAIVLTDVEKNLLEMAEQSPEKLQKVDFINKWVFVMRNEFKQLDYGVERAALIFGQFYL